MSIVSRIESVIKYNSVQDVSFDAVTKASISLLYVLGLEISYSQSLYFTKISNQLFIFVAASENNPANSLHFIRIRNKQNMSFIPIRITYLLYLNQIYLQ